MVIERIGPYHVARLNALGQRMFNAYKLFALEICYKDQTYSWDPMLEADVAWRRETLFRELPRRNPLRRTQAVWSALSRLRPDFTAIPGWGTPESIAALLWSNRNSVPCLLMSDSTAEDAPRVAWKEAVKGALVKRAQAGFVAGTRHRKYLERLGMPAEIITTGYDVVDNAHFARGADAARKDAAEFRMRLGLPDRYLLSICRFVEKKNLRRLVAGYAQYRQQATDGPVQLVIVGDGPMKSELQRFVHAKGLDGVVRVHPFAQYDLLPVYYGLASGFILASTTEQWGLVVNEAMAAGLPVLVSTGCGCQPDLVIEGETGVSFDPYNEAAIAGAIAAVMNSPATCAGMGKKAAEWITNYSLDNFCEGFCTAMRLATLGRPEN